MTYRLDVTSRVVKLTALGLVIAASAAGSSATTPRLTLDGAAFRPELALTSAQREVGLMRRQKAPVDGMLFVFPRRTRDGFWMKNTLVPLAIVFFDASGRRVRKLSMTPCTSEPCAVYYPNRTYRFALELPATDRRPARTLGPLASLRVLLARAR